MKAFILCGGYATRMYPLTLNKPKHLLPIAGKPMLEYAVNKLNEIPGIDRIYLVTNHKFVSAFENWVKTLKQKKQIQIFDNGTLSDETKLGAIGDMKFVIEKIQLNDDLLVLAGDNLFQLNLQDFIRFSKDRITVAVYDVKNKELMKKYGEVKLDKDGKFISFREKPAEPETTLAAICLYFFPKEKVNLITKYINEGNNTDQPGRYIQWLYKRQPVYGFVFTEKWYDIGDINEYERADKEYRLLRKNSGEII